MKPHPNDLLNQAGHVPDKLTNYFLPAYFIAGLLLASCYNTWSIAILPCGLCLLAYYAVKFSLPGAKLYQYVLSVVLGIFTIQFVYQMHGMPAMYSFAFIGSVFLILYRNWKLQIPLALVVILHQAVSGYVQLAGPYKIYFIQQLYMNLQTSLVYILLSSVIFSICGFMAYRFKIAEESSIAKIFEISRLQAINSQNAMQIKMEEERRVSQEKKMAAEMILKQQQFIAALMGAREKERSCLGEELYNYINPILVTAKLYLDSALSEEDRSRELIHQSKDYITTAMSQIRKLSRLLVYPSLRDTSITVALTDMIEHFKATHNIIFVTKWNTINEEEFTEKLKITIYRIFLEQMNNIFEHSNAKKVFISIEQRDDLLVFTIKDDGVGFDMSEKKNGVGLQSIISLAGLCKGETNIHSSPGMSCQLSIRFHLAESLSEVV